MPRMHTRPGFTNIGLQIPTVLYDEWKRRALEQRQTITGFLEAMLAKEFNIPISELPVPIKLGRKPKKGSRR